MFQFATIPVVFVRKSGHARAFVEIYYPGIEARHLSRVACEIFNDIGGVFNKLADVNDKKGRIKIIQER